MSVSAAEQYFIELINRARLDPAAEAQRLGIALNEELPAGTISTASKTPLAVNLQLTQSSRDHSNWMLDADVFSHTGSGGSSVRQRIEAANYTLSGSWAVGENLSWRTVSGANNETLIDAHHRALFDSSGHRKNFFSDAYREIGVAEEKGNFRYAGDTYYSSMVTHNFAKSGSLFFLTGVAYVDGDRDKFYSIGEGRGGYEFSAQGRSDVSMSAGGYAVTITPTTNLTVTIEAPSKTGQVVIDASDGNVKLDIINQAMVTSSASMTLKTAFPHAKLLGGDDLDLTGNNVSNILEGNDGSNTLIGHLGNDTLRGFDGNDLLAGSAGNDVILGMNGRDDLRGGGGRDLLKGDGSNDRLSGDRGDDTLYGGFSNDRLDGGDDDDRVYGDGGSDHILGGAGRDLLFGGLHNDKFNGGSGADNMWGGPGADEFVYRRGNEWDNIRDFKTGQNDRLLIDDALWSGNLTPQQVIDQFGASNSELSAFKFGNGDILVLQGILDLDDIVDHIDII